MTPGRKLSRLLRSRAAGHAGVSDRHARRYTGREGRRLALRALERLGEPVSVTSADGRLVFVNAAARDLRADLGVPAGEATPGDVEAGAVAADGRPIPVDTLPTETTRVSGRPCTHAEIGLRTQDGDIRWLRATTRRLDEDGPPYAVVSSYARVPEPLATLAAIHAQPEAPDPHAPLPEPADRTTGEEPELRQARELFLTAFQRAPIGMALVGSDFAWIRVNQALCDLLGYSEPELMARTWVEVTHPDDLDAQIAVTREVLAGRRAGYEMEKRYIHADGHTLWVSISVSLVTDELGRPLHLISQIVDITARHLMEQRLQHLADHDPLTGVLNRRRFEEELIRQLDRCRRYDEHAVLVMLDLDGFKAINDAHGHAAGDEVLEAVAAALLAKIRSSDVLARVGGDEFALILVGVGPEQAQVAIEGLAAVVRNLEGLSARVTVSVGATVMRAADRTDEVLLRADEAMYRVKASGRDGALVDDSGREPD